MYLSEVTREGKTMTEAAKVWKTMLAEEKEQYIAKAELYDGSSKPTAEGKTLKQLTRKRSAYQVYISESVKAGVKLGDAASRWKELSEESKAKYEELARLGVQSAPAQ